MIGLRIQPFDEKRIRINKLTPDGSKAYVADSGSSYITPITVATDTIGTQFAVGSAPQGVAISPDETISPPSVACTGSSSSRTSRKLSSRWAAPVVSLRPAMPGARRNIAEGRGTGATVLN